MSIQIELSFESKDRFEKKKRKKYDIITDVIKHRSISRKNIFTRGGGKKIASPKLQRCNEEPPR